MNRSAPRPQAQPRLRPKGLALGLVIGAVGAIGLALAPVAELEERFGLPWMFLLRGAVAAPADVVIVAIDEASIRALALPDKPSLWPRSLHGELVRRLSEAGASVIAFDMTFETPSTTATADAQFASAMADAGNVIFAEAVRRESSPLFDANHDTLGVADMERVISALPLLAQSAFDRAPFVLPKESRVSSFQSFRHDSGDEPTLPMVAFQVHARRAHLALLQALQTLDSAAAPASNTARAERAALVAQPGSGGPGEALAGAMRHARDILRLDQNAAAGLALAASNLAPGDLQLMHRLADLYADPAVRYLNFYGPPRTIETLSYSDVLRDARSARTGWQSRFRGKVVFVGYSAVSPQGQDRVRDDYRTVYSQANGGDLSGVEIAATAFANLADGSSLVPIDWVWRLAIVGGWGLALGLIARLQRPPVAVVVSAALTASLLGLTYVAFRDRSWWLPSIIPTCVQMPLALFVGVLLSEREARAGRRSLKKAVSYFLPSEVIDGFDRDGDSMQQANRTAFGVCLSTDVESYTSMAERMLPAALASMMNRYYERLFVPVERHKGVVVDLIGDSMLAIWANPISQAEIRRRACSAALEIAEALDHRTDADEDASRLPTRFGLHAGDVLMGSIGASGHYEYRAVGDIVNTTARIQSLNKVFGTRVLASEEVVASIEDLAVRPLGRFLLAGKTNAVTVVEVLGWGRDMKAERLAARDHFATALALYQQARFADAADAFDALLTRHGSDGPGRFYLEHCRRLQHAPPPAATWQSTISIGK